MEAIDCGEVVVRHLPDGAELFRTSGHAGGQAMALLDDGSLAVLGNIVKANNRIDIGKYHLQIYSSKGERQHVGNQTLLDANAHMKMRAKPKAGRGGRALLTGIVRCGRSAVVAHLGRLSVPNQWSPELEAGGLGHRLCDEDRLGSAR